MTWARLRYPSWADVPGNLRNFAYHENGETIVEVVASQYHHSQTANIQNQLIYSQSKQVQMQSILDEVRTVMLFAAEHKEHYVVKVDQFDPEVNFLDWCKRNCRGEFHAFVLEPSTREPKPTIFGVFAYERDATLFKLFLTE